MALATKVYEQVQKEQSQETTNNTSDNKKDDGVVDAEYEEK